MSTQDSKKRRTQDERRAESERKLFDSLVQIIVNEGIGAATCENIGRLAGYSRGLTTTRLGRREEMFEKLIQRLRAERLIRLQSKLNGEMNRRDILKTFIEIHFNDVKNDLSYKAYFVLAAGSVVEMPALRIAVRDAHDFVRDFLAGYIKEGIESGEFPPTVDPMERATALVCYLFGSATLHHIHPNFSIEILKYGAYNLLPESKN